MFKSLYIVLLAAGFVCFNMAAASVDLNTIDESKASFFSLRLPEPPYV